MNRRNSVLAVSALTLGAVGLIGTEASARVPDEEGSPSVGGALHDPPVEEYTPQVPSASDDNGVEALQAGASALGGAGIAFGAMWLHRRRHLPAT